MNPPLVFPPDFIWGVATSAPQIEGAVAVEGRGESIWDRFARIPGRIRDGSDPSIACDHYHRWEEDVALLGDLGVGAYRFSVAWPRVLPGGGGPPNPAGLAFYDRLVDALLEQGIEPWITLYHWDLPQALQDRGGWLSRDTAAVFADYAALVAGHLGDRVTRWITHNEPWCVSVLGHEDGEHAPGHRSPAEALRTSHHLLLSHGWAGVAIRSMAPGSEVGIVLNLMPVAPATPSSADRDAARRLDGTFNRWFLDPLFLGHYPVDVIRDRFRRGHLEQPDLPYVEPGDLEAISDPMDFLGINYYSRAVVRADEAGEPVGVAMVPAEDRTTMGWEVFPRGLHDLLLRVHRDYEPASILITENGAAFPDVVDETGQVADPRRIAFLRDHLAAAHRAIGDGVPLGGFFAWTLLDNFEWAYGYTQRFGLYRVDPVTRKRIPKESAFWFRDVVTTGEVRDETTQARRLP